jgi:hypothetical protein
MKRRALQLTVILCLCLVGGCTYSRYDGWQWDGRGAGHAIIDTLFSLGDNRSASERMDDDADEFFDN